MALHEHHRHHREEKIESWNDLFVKMVELGLGAASLTVEATQKLVDDLVSRGQVTKEESHGLVDRLLKMGHEQREQISDMIDKTVEKAMARMDVARRSDLDAVRERLCEVERILTCMPTVEESIPPLHESEINDYE